MANEKKSSHKKKTVLNNAFPTIGLLTEGLSGEYQAGLWPGITETIKTHQCNLICFCGGSLDVASENPWDYQGNVLYDIAEKNDLDGLIIAGSLGSYVSDNVLSEFLERFRHIPAVTLAPAIESIPAVFVDNRSGLRSLMAHLVEYHKYQNIVFIRGPEGNVEAEERLKIFQSVLEEHHIPLNPEYILSGDFTRQCGADAVNRLVQSKLEFEVIVAADDATALGALQALQKNGISVPEDVALVGFDDIEESGYVTPPLTTVNQPLFEMGKTAVELLLRLMQGEKIPKNTILEAKLIVRQSCGCFKQFTSLEKAGKVLSEQRAEEKKLDETKMRSHLMRIFDAGYKQFAAEIAECYCSDVNNHVNISFLKKVNKIGMTLLQQDNSGTFWLNMIFELWYYSFSHLDTDTFAFADDLLHKARVICGDLHLRDQGVRRIQTVRENYFLHEIGDVLKNTLDVQKLLDAICINLPQLGFKSFYLTLYDSPKKIFHKTSRLMLAYVNGKKRVIDREGVAFDTNEILPANTVPKNNLHVLVTEPLYFQKEQFGIAFFEAEISEYERYEVLREYISGALHSALLIEKVQQQAEILARANTELEKMREKEHAYLQTIKGELELGRKIQKSFLPQRLPQMNGYDLAVAFMPAREVSGDFYDAFRLDTDMVVLIIADVSGKDVSAALFMALIRTLLRVFSERAHADGDDPLEAIEVVNNYIIQHHRRGDERCMFATIFLAILTPSTGELRYINAGHNAPLVLEKKEICKELSPTGPAVGLALDLKFKQGSISIAPGQMIFAYTDGVTEAQNQAGEFFTSKRLLTILKEQAVSSAAAKIDMVKKELNKHSREAAPFDDITMLVLKRE